MTSKFCPLCNSTKPLTDFAGVKKKDYYCKVCKARLMRESRVRIAALGVTRAVKDRFWRRVNKIEGGCWLWTGKPKADGYGQFWVAGKVKYAHRVALDFLGVYIPEGMDADHTCRNRLCVSPYHLRAVTERQNATENNGSPFAVNAQKTHCKYGHPLAGDNIQLVRTRGPKGSMCTTRKCLACYGPGGIRRRAA